MFIRRTMVQSAKTVSGTAGWFTPSPDSSLLSALNALRFDNRRTQDLRHITDADWQKLLPLIDHARITLPMGLRCDGSLPDWVQARIGQNLARTTQRYQRVVESYQEIAHLLEARGIEFLVLKGLSHWPFYCDDPITRPQYDLDLFCPAFSIGLAHEAVASLGYQPVHPRARTATDHLPAMIRKTGWRWRGDYYDPDMPLNVELHFRFWDPNTEHFDVPGSERFWSRRTVRHIKGLPLPTLHPSDGFSYATWHLLRHLLRGDLLLYHVYEIAHFLDRTADHQVFWCDWRAKRESDLVEAIASRLAAEWFGCRLNQVMQESLERLPLPVRRWFDLFALSPVLALDHPNKDELFLHLCLVKGWRAPLRIALRRLFPPLPSRAIVDAHVPSPTLRLRWKRATFQVLFIAGRALHHVRTLAPVLRNACRWLRQGRTHRVGNAPL